MGGGAWPFLVGGAICLVNSVNERDLSLLNSYVEVCDALRCSGPHARYTDVFNESIALADRPGKRESSARVDYVPALCTHRPSLLPIEWSGEVFGLRDVGGSLPATFLTGESVYLRRDDTCVVLPFCREGVGHALHSPASLSRRNTNPGASCAKEIETVKGDSRGPGDSVLWVLSRHMMQNDSRQRISRLLHR
ncbi:hypothetical protein VNO78_16415 [Psophocarpus tetragonolobus]|uniref:Uncharacterized protein n=3 Tax=Phaseoleae TaxID=163735 RepID=A0AAN9SFU1_PSOTE